MMTMLKKMLSAAALALAASGAYAAASVYAASAPTVAVDINKANQAELETIKGIGPSLSQRILDERAKHGVFKDWTDLVQRVPGVAGGNAARLSSGGLTVGGSSYHGALAEKSPNAQQPAAAASDAQSGSQR